MQTEKKYSFAVDFNHFLTFTILFTNSAGDKLMIFLLFSPENRLWHFMQIVSIEEISKLFLYFVFWKFFP